jgi:anti-anti-sigma factor
MLQKKAGEVLMTQGTCDVMTFRSKMAVVLNCSHLHEMDLSSVHLLLCCLEEAMKRNGDVRLAALSPLAKDCLRGLGVDRLFRIFETSEQAVQSFQRRGAFVSPFMPAVANVPAENAA